MTVTAQNIPDGYMMDAQRRLVPVELVKPIDKLRDELVRELIDEAEAVSQQVAEFKERTFKRIADFVSLSAQEYGINWGGEKGNVTLTSYDAEYRVIRSIDEYNTFTEQLNVAKEIIDQCIHRWSEGSRVEIRALIQDAFQVDKKGRVNVRRIMALRKLDIQDEQWQTAMAAISESLQTAGTKECVRIYKRNGRGEYEQISLDVAK